MRLRATAGVLAAWAAASGALGAQQVVARLAVEPASVEVGEPFVATLEVEHPSGLRVSTPAALELDDSWVLLGEEGRATRPDPDEPGRALTTRRFTLASLEPGARALPALAVEWRVGETSGSAESAPAALDVRPVLGPEERAPRPLPGFREVAEPGAHPLVWGLRALLAAALAGLVWRAVRRARARRGRAAPVAEPGPREVLAGLAAGLEARADPERARELYYVVTREVRRAAEQRGMPGEVARAHAALSDDEWLASVAPRALEAPLEGRVAELLRACEEVKYGSAAPSALGLRATLERAREVVDELAPAVQGGAR